MEAQFARLVSAIVYQLYARNPESISSDILYILHVVCDLLAKALMQYFSAQKKALQNCTLIFLLPSSSFEYFGKERMGALSSFNQSRKWSKTSGSSSGRFITPSIASSKFVQKAPLKEEESSHRSFLLTLYVLIFGAVAMWMVTVSSWRAVSS